MSEEEARKKLEALVAQADLDEVVDELAKLSPEDIAKENAAAGYDAEADVARKRKLVEAALREKEGGGAKVIPLAPKRRINWNMVAMAAVVLLVAGIIWRLARSGGEPDIPVSHPFCEDVTRGEPIEGILSRDGATFLLNVKDDVCGPDPKRPVHVLELDVSHANVDLAPLVNKDVRIQGRATMRDAARPIVVAVESVSPTTD